MKTAEVRFDPVTGVEVGKVCQVPWFVQELEELDMTTVTMAILIVVQETGEVTTRTEGGSNLEAIGAMEIAKNHIVNVFQGVDQDDEEDDGEDSGD